MKADYKGDQGLVHSSADSQQDLKSCSDKSEHDAIQQELSDLRVLFGEGQEDETLLATELWPGAMMFTEQLDVSCLSAIIP